ncbi:hypothetical protein CAPTEDRAFT_215775 [Capitella teleta]|uniref:Uncharacterized protein n=1 Tax=Capitella teleta TaxID=283909 RepID=R7VHP9_CAPTE|nr:hypothetical protein CAPTEDRAFT_215775 [Capitella teleta]|eukprot:ELU15826.1 hypothetical protein CAPTEDRAFT_215775 [Capitella teleta]
MTQLWHRPPIITPNYGKKKPFIPRSSLYQVLLHDNVSQEQLMQARLAHISADQNKRMRLLEQHRRTFLLAQSLKQERLRAKGVRHISLLPDQVAYAHAHASKFTTPANARKLSGIPRTETPPSVENAKNFMTHEFRLKCDVTPNVVIEDRRFSGLEGSLTSPDRCSGGYLQLSPGGRQLLRQFDGVQPFDDIRRLSQQFERVDNKSNFNE